MGLREGGGPRRGRRPLKGSFFVIIFSKNPRKQWSWSGGNVRGGVLSQRIRERGEGGFQGGGKNKGKQMESTVSLLNRKEAGTRSDSASQKEESEASSRTCAVRGKPGGGDHPGTVKNQSKRRTEE